jgi:sigma-B regulation protein RsbU (phosphoserine phosphatase)
MGVMGMLLLVSLGGIAFFSVRFTTALTAPILALNRGVQEVSAGSLDREVQIKTGDELEQLAVSFNLMTSRLAGHIAQIERATAEKERITTELDIAERIQMSMLPVDFPPYPGRKNEFDLFASIHPAREVGGDFYDFFFIDDDHFALLIADVSGKGVPAALFMAITMTLIENHIQSGDDPDLALESVNRQLCGKNIEGMFVTLWLGVLELSSGRLRYINAGHNPPLLGRRGGDGKGNFAFEFLRSPPDLVLAAMDDTLYRIQETGLADGDTLFLYTDGINEAANARGEFYGNEKLRAFMNDHKPLGLRELLPALKADIDAFCAGAEQSDDITMLVLRCQRDARAGGEASLSVKADVKNLARLTAFLSGELGRHGCPPKTRGQIELAAEEIFVNIARYAYRNREGLPSYAFDVDIRCRLEEGGGETEMTLAFSDRGDPFNPLEHVDPDLDVSMPERDVGGLGILLVKRTMDSVRYERENETNRLIIKKSWIQECL